MDSRFQKLLVVFFMCCITTVQAQINFIQSGRVEYEKKVNQHKDFEDDPDDVWNKERMKVIPKFVTDIYELRFNNTKSFYKLAKENPDNKYMMWGGRPSETDGVVIDLTNNQVSAQKEIFENTYLIKDSIKTYDWRITDETREIAGFECRKAVTKICDSVYVVAFYTDQIPVSVGPENFGGLPGLILGLAIPRLSTTWFATKLELVDPSVTQLSPTQKGKKVTRLQMVAELQKGLKDWGKEGAKRMWLAQL
ncbi:MAG: GLPGLI family protein [Chitinophagaceae bacterium]|nr:GLPGLI family protein [Chitinophagaceae bacterium]